MRLPAPIEHDLKSAKIRAIEYAESFIGRDVFVDMNHSKVSGIRRARIYAAEVNEYEVFVKIKIYSKHKRDGSEFIEHNFVETQYFNPLSKYKLARGL